MTTALRGLGKVRTETALSRVKARKLSVMTEFVLSPLGIKEKEGEKHGAKPREILRKKYRGAAGYSFPTPHIVICVKKA